MARNTRSNKTRARDCEAVPDMVSILNDYVRRYAELNNASRKVAR